jgi:DNA helicase II / ATP-dependent DNA helicase PcrA
MDPQESIFAGLNQAQQEAVRADSGPVLVVAGPGTGKTLTIIRRIAHLINQAVEPTSIAAVTFTNRAAREMRERATALLGDVSENIFIGTLHLLGLRILQEVLPDRFVIFDREEQIGLLKGLTKGSGLTPDEAADKISRAKGLIEDTDDGIRGIYDAYQSSLSNNGALDFDDLIAKPLELFQDQYLLAKYRDRVKHIIVDEYQDINPAQYRLLSLLAGESGNICAVGDSDQAIYAFRGADVRNFMNFEEHFSQAQRITLRDSYRSTGTILKASDIMIRNNAARIEKVIRPIKGGGSRITLVSVPDERSEGDIVVGEIEARIGGSSHYSLMRSHSRGDFAGASYCFSDFAVIYRTNAQAKALEEAFTELGIPCQIVGKKKGRKRTEAADIVARFKSSGQVPQDSIEALCAELGFADRSIFETSDREGRLTDLINMLCLLTPADDFDPRGEAVTLMTLHMAKGLEFRVVFIAGVEDGLMPYTLARRPADIEEERRLLYVGMTRAQEELFLLHARNRTVYGQRLARSLSPFVKEIPEEFLVKRIVPDRPKKKDKEEKQMKLF